MRAIGPGSNWRLVLAAGVLGLAFALVLAFTGSPLIFLGALGGMALAVAILQNPRLGLYLAIATVPLEAAGRLGNILPNVNITFAKVFALITVVSWLIQLGARRIDFLWTPEMRALLAYLLAGAFSLADTAEFELGYQALIRFSATMLFYLLILNLLRTREHFRIALGLFVAVSLVTFAFALAQRYLPGFAFHERAGWDRAGALTFGVEMATLDAGRFETVARSSGVSFHAIVLAVNTDFILPVLLAGILLARNLWQKAGLWAAVGICIAANASAYSRTGLVILALILPLLVHFRLLRVTALHVVVAAIIGASIVPFLPESFIDRILTLDSYTVAGSESLRQRVDLIAAGWHAFLDHPVNGLGLETTYRIFDYFEYEDQGAVVTVHNGYVQTMLELGVPGIASLLAFFWMTLRRFLKAEALFRVQGDEMMRLVSRALWVSLIAFMMAGMTLDFMRIGFKNMWVIMAFAPTLFMIAKRAESEKDLRDPRHGQPVHPAGWRV